MHWSHPLEDFGKEPDSEIIFEALGIVLVRTIGDFTKEVAT